MQTPTAKRPGTISRQTPERHGTRDLLRPTLLEVPPGIWSPIPLPAEALEPSVGLFWEVSVGPSGRSRAVFLARAWEGEWPSLFRGGKRATRGGPPSLRKAGPIPVPTP